MLFWELMAFEKVEKRVAETALVIVLNVNYGLFLLETQEVGTTRVPR